MLWTRDRKKRGGKVDFPPPFFCLFLFFLLAFFSVIIIVWKRYVFTREEDWEFNGGKNRVGVHLQGAENEGQSVCGTGRQDSAGGGVCEAH